MRGKCAGVVPEALGATTAGTAGRLQGGPVGTPSQPFALQIDRFLDVFRPKADIAIAK